MRIPKIQCETVETFFYVVVFFKRECKFKYWYECLMAYDSKWSRNDLDENKFIAEGSRKNYFNT